MLILELVMPILVLGVYPSEMGLGPTGRGLSAWGVFSCLTNIGVPMQLKGASAISQEEHVTNHLFLI